MKVSVLMITYNHEPYIAAAIESVLAQQVDFPVELVIGEDCSTDATLSIIERYAAAHPQTIRLLPAEKNLGFMENFLRTLAAGRGDYVAILEGDDFWTSPEKLRRQIAFLDSHPEFVGSFHNARILNETSPQEEQLCLKSPPATHAFGVADLIKENFIPTCSVVFRRDPGLRLPDWFKSMPMADWPLHVLNTERGPYHYIDEVLATYRVHPGGLWSGTRRIRIVETSIETILVLDRHLKGKYRQTVRKTITKWELEILRILLQEKQTGKALRRLPHGLAISGYSWKYFARSSKYVLRHFLRRPGY